MLFTIKVTTCSDCFFHEVPILRTIRAGSGLTALDYAQRPALWGATPCPDLVDMLKSAVLQWEHQPAKPSPPPFLPRGYKHKGDDIAKEEIDRTIAFAVPIRMTVQAVAPLVRERASPVSPAIGRLVAGATILAKASCHLGNTTYVPFVQGSSECPEGWVTFYLPSSNTIILRPEPGAI